MTLPILNPKFDQPLRYLQVEPSSMEEAAEMSRLIEQELASIEVQLRDPERKEMLGGIEYLHWCSRAKKAKLVKKEQLRELRAWRAARQLPAVAGAKAERDREKTLEKRRVHAAKIANAVEQAGLGNPVRGEELLRLLRVVFLNAKEDGVDFPPEEEALLTVTGEYLHFLDGQDCTFTPGYLQMADQEQEAAD